MRSRNSSASSGPSRTISIFVPPRSMPMRYWDMTDMTSSRARPEPGRRLFRADRDVEQIQCRVRRRRCEVSSDGSTLARFRGAPHNKPMSETLLDVKGMSCPLPVLRANRSLRSMAPGERLRVLATDRAAVADFQSYCQETGHALLAWSEEGGVFSFVIRRRAEDSAPGEGA